MILVNLLRGAWIAGTIPILIATMPTPKLHSFRNLLLAFAKCGKILQSHSRKGTVPQKYFCHFYIIAVLWTTILLVSTWMYAYREAPDISEPLVLHNIASQLTGSSHYFSSWGKKDYTIWKSVLLLLLMEAQVLRRLFESVYVFNYSPFARMHVFGYLTGLFFYIAAPLSLCCKNSSEIFKFVINLAQEFVVKGKDRMRMTEYDLLGHINPLLHLKWHVWIGTAVFSWGWIHQRRCHVILGCLRENLQAEEYTIPYGDWFEYVSSAHYLAEIVIYGGLVIASGFYDITIWLLFGFVVANLVFVAVETHKWYLRRFDDYPKNRRAIIPFIY